MVKKIKFLFIILLVSIISIGGLAAQAAGPLFQVDTPAPENGTPTSTPDEILDGSELGDSNGITFWGLVIIAIILVPMLILRKEW
jgi:hypothetical protein